MAAVCFSNSALSHGVGSGVPGRHQILPFQLCRIVERRHVRLPGLRALPGGPRLVRDIGRVVLVGKRGEVMAELVDEHVRRERTVHRGRRLIVENAPSAVGPIVHEDFNEFVRRGRRRVTQAPGCRA